MNRSLLAEDYVSQAMPKKEVIDEYNKEMQEMEEQKKEIFSKGDIIKFYAVKNKRWSETCWYPQWGSFQVFSLPLLTFKEVLKYGVSGILSFSGILVS